MISITLFDKEFYVRIFVRTYLFFIDSGDRRIFVIGVTDAEIIVDTGWFRVGGTDP